MNSRQEQAVKTIMDALLALPFEERADVWSAVAFNDVFCVHCGYGEPDGPNPRCQCTNDD